MKDPIMLRAQACGMTTNELQQFFDYCWDHQIHSSTAIGVGRIEVSIANNRYVAGWKSGSYFYKSKEFIEAFEYATRYRTCRTGLMRKIDSLQRNNGASR